MAPMSALVRVMCVIGALVVALSGCTGSEAPQEPPNQSTVIDIENTVRRYSAEWLVNASAVGIDDIESPYFYREVVDDQTGTYLVEAPNHLALQFEDEVVFCAAVRRIPLDPYCATSPRAEGAPRVLSYPIQLLRDWSPRGLYDLASYREVSLVASADPDNWSRQLTRGNNDIPIECFLVTGETSAANTGFEICFTNDDLHLVASVDLQHDLVFEIDLRYYERFNVIGDFETGLDEFFEAKPSLQEQLLDLYPEIPAPRPTPTPESG